MEKLPAAEKNSAPEENATEAENRYSSWRELFGSEKILARANAIFLAAAGWTLMEAAGLEAKDLKVVEHKTHVTVEFDQQSKRENAPERAHVRLHHLNDFDAESALGEEIPANEITQFVPNIYPGEEIKAVRQEVVDSFMEKQLKNPLLRAYAGISSEEEAENPTPQQEFKSILYIIKTHFNYNLEDKKFDRYEMLEDYFRTTEFYHTNLAEGILKLPAILKQIPDAQEAIKKAHKELEIFDGKTREERRAETKRISRYDLERTLDLAQRLEKGLFMEFGFIAGTKDAAAVSGSDTASPEGSLESSYAGLEKGVFESPFKPEKKIIHGAYRDAMKHLSAPLRERFARDMKPDELHAFERKAHALHKKYLSEYTKAHKEYTRLKTKMEAADKKSADTLFANGKMVCRNSSDMAEYMHQWMKAHRGNHLKNSFLLKLTAPSTDVFRTTGDSRHAFNLGVVVTEKANSRYVLEEVHFDPTPSSTRGEKAETLEAKEKKHRREKAPLLPFGGESLFPSMEFALIKKLYLQEMISADDLVRIFSEGSPKSDLAEQKALELKKLAKSETPGKDVVAEGNAYKEYFERQSAVFENVQRMYPYLDFHAQPDEKLLEASFRHLSRLLLEYGHFLRGKKEVLQSIGKRAPAGAFWSAPAGLAFLSTKNPAESALYSIVGKYGDSLPPLNKQLSIGFLERVIPQIEALKEPAKEAGFASDTVTSILKKKIEELKKEATQEPGPETDRFKELEDELKQGIK